MSMFSQDLLRFSTSTRSRKSKRCTVPVRKASVLFQFPLFINIFHDSYALSIKILTYKLLFGIIPPMNNKFIKSPAELQKHVDYIIELSDITDYSEKGIAREEVHLNVDLVLSEPLSILKRNKMIREQNSKHLTPNVGELGTHYHRNSPTMPKREYLIAHADHQKNNPVTLMEVLFSLFKTNYYKPR